MIEVTIAFITGVISPIALLLVKNWLDKRKDKKDPITETLLLSFISRFRFVCKFEEKF